MLRLVEACGFQAIIPIENSRYVLVYTAASNGLLKTYLYSYFYF